MIKHAALAAFGLAVLIAGFASAPIVSVAAPDPAYTPVPQPKPDFSSMMFLTGPWSCTQMVRGKQRPDTSTTAIGEDGVWMVTDDTAPPFDQYRTFAVKSKNYMTYDPSIKQWVVIAVDNSGGYGVTTSPGWQGNKITWTTKNLDGSSGTDVTTKVSDTETTDASTGTDAQGHTTTTTIHCTKTAGQAP